LDDKIAQAWGPIVRKGLNDGKDFGTVGKVGRGRLVFQKRLLALYTNNRAGQRIGRGPSGGKSSLLPDGSQCKATPGLGKGNYSRKNGGEDIPLVKEGEKGRDQRKSGGRTGLVAWKGRERSCLRKVR